MPHDLRPISREEFHALSRHLVGMPVSRAWRGHGSAVFLELGALHVHQSPRGPTGDQGEATVMVEWSWRVEGPRSVRFGSWSTDRRMDNAIPGLAGRTVESVEAWGRIPELAVGLSGGLALVSFTTVESQPQWAVFLREGDWVFVQRGRLFRDTWHDEPGAGTDLGG